MSNPLARRSSYFVIAGLAVIAFSCGVMGDNAVLLDDDFSALEARMVSAPVGPHTEYHYLPEAAPFGNWAVSCFTWEQPAQRAWWIQQEDDGNHVLAQTFDSEQMTHTHPLVVTGDTLWTDYDVVVRWALDSSREGRSGVAFRYRNDRCYYFFGFEGNQLVLMRVNHATGFRQPDEKILASEIFPREQGKYQVATISVRGSNITAKLAGGPELSATDSTFGHGKVALLSDIPVRYDRVQVTCSADEKQRIDALKAEHARMEAQLQESNPRPVLWKKISTKGFGVGRNLRFGDLDGDGVTDVLIGQVRHHAAPRDSYSELSCLTAMTFDGEILWRIGEPDPEKDHLTNDVAFQIHDIDGDGANEVVYTMGMELIVADGATGVVKYKAPTPVAKAPADSFPRILGDCLYFCDLRGTGRDADIIIKDRYWHIWALDDKLNTMWEGECRTGHYPYAYDTDGDGRDELVIGYSLFDDNGKKLWSLDELVDDHADGVAVVDYDGDGPMAPRYFCAASDAGVFWAGLDGEILTHHWIGHGQNPAVADFRPDLPGLESLSINFWGNQGIIHFYDSSGEIYHDFEPNQYGSMCLPVNWTGEPGEYWVHSPNVAEGGMYDGLGRRVVSFPADGHPDMCNAVLDITGDARDEIVVWDPDEIWVYTQDDNPKQGRLYKPVRNPLYNYSNYQTTVSLPGWSE
ncbi:MAG: hypothetical protein FVQ81_08290 [Candidatus Glassbacteria bacterium]|nr:hypothetical protein [Candidatus Glassbacteria bacterium]